jgi:hypothetical protein
MISAKKHKLGEKTKRRGCCIILQPEWRMAPQKSAPMIGNIVDLIGATRGLWQLACLVWVPCGGTERTLLEFVSHILCRWR